MQNLSNELDKLILYTGKRKTITGIDVKNVTGASRQFNIFELQNSIGAGDVKRAIFILDRMLTEGESPTGIVVMLSRYFSVLWKLNERGTESVSSAELAREVGVPFFYFNSYASAAKRYGVEQLERAFEQLLYADACIKRGVANIALALTLPIVALIKPWLFARGFSPLLGERIVN